MKKLAATSLMALALGMPGAPVWAADFEAEQIQQLVVSGYVDGWIGYSFVNDGDGGSDGPGNFTPDSNEYWTTGQAGRLSFPLSDLLAVQMDFVNEITENAFRSNVDDDFAHSFDFGLHMSARDPSRGLLGVFGAFGQGKATDSSSDDDRHDYWAIGGEAQLYTDMATFYLQGGYLDSEGRAGTVDDGLHQALFVRGVGRWFMTPDSRLQGEVAYAHGKQDQRGRNGSRGVHDMDVIQWGVRYDTVIAGLPIVGDTAVFVGYRGTHFDNGCCGADDNDRGRFTEHTVMVGYAYQFGGLTWLDFDRVGATLDLPTFGRWVAGGDQID